MTTIKSTRTGGPAPSDKLRAGAREESNRPTEMELMLYFDDELEEGRRAEIRAYIAQDSGAQDKLSGLRITSALLREQALVSSLSVDIATSVMAEIEAGQEVPAPSIKSAAGVEAGESRWSTRDKPKAANDNSRSIFTLAALAVAAAAAMMIWGRTAPEIMRAAENGPATTQASPPLPVQPLPAEAEPAEAPAPESDMDHGVEVAAVDFGAHMGTIFYVPTGAAVSSATTTVVWVDDEVVGGK